MIFIIIVACVIVYLLIGGFLSGACERELSPVWVLAWPLLIFILLACIIAKIPVEIGKKYYIKVDKWFQDHI